MDLTELKASKEVDVQTCSNQGVAISSGTSNSDEASVSLETEIPEVLYRGMKEFICTHPEWDQYQLMSSALANFLFQNGSDDRAVTERYLNDLFALTNS